MKMGKIIAESPSVPATDLDGMMTEWEGKRRAVQDAQRDLAFAEYEMVKYLSDRREYGLLKLNPSAISRRIR